MKVHSIGKQIRASRFRFPGADTGLIVPIDHGLTIGPVGGIRNTSEIAGWISHPAVCGVVAHKGIVERLADRGALAGKGVLLHLNGMSAIAPAPNRKEMLAAVTTGLRLGVDGVSLQLNFDGANDAHNLTLLGATTDEAQKYGLPVLTMLYDKAAPADESVQLERLRHLVRITIELGTDAIKLAPPRSFSMLRSLLAEVGEDVSVYFAGGELMRDDQLFAFAEQVASHGAAGLCVGRNVFQRAQPGPVLDRLKHILTQKREVPIFSPTLRAANELL